MVEYRSPRLGFYNINCGYSPSRHTPESQGKLQMRAFRSIVLGPRPLNGKAHYTRVLHAYRGALHGALTFCYVVLSITTQNDKNFSSGAVRSHTPALLVLACRKQRTTSSVSSTGGRSAFADDLLADFAKTCCTPLRNDLRSL